MSRSHWLMAAALAMFIAAPAMSQQPIRDPSIMDPSQADERVHPRRRLEVHRAAPTSRSVEPDGPPRPYSTALIGDSMPSKYWLGIYCSPVPPALRAHVTLPEKQGLLAMSITKDSPAAKAGIAQYDILLRAGGKPLADPRDCGCHRGGEGNQAEDRADPRRQTANHRGDAGQAARSNRGHIRPSARAGRLEHDSRLDGKHDARSNVEFHGISSAAIPPVPTRRDRAQECSRSPSRCRRT